MHFQPSMIPALFLLACTTESAQPTIELPPNGGIRDVIHVPAGATPFSGAAFVFTGPTAPGSASFANAPVSPPEIPPSTVGTGAMSITVNSDVYSSMALETMATVIPDASDEYLAVGGFRTYMVGGVEHADQVVVIVLRSDFAVGATVALDGQHRFAMFGTGPIELAEPTLVAAAITGTVTFSAGAIAPDGTGSITASVAGDFGEVDYVPAPPPMGGSITAGAYTLAVTGPADVLCDGSLAGQEAAFASIGAANLGFIGGAVNVTMPTPGKVAVAGAPIMSAFGAASLDLEPSGDGLLAGFIDETVPGPAGTTRLGKFLVLDESTASVTFVNGGVGAGYANATGTCSVSFGASLTP